MEVTIKDDKKSAEDWIKKANLEDTMIFQGGAIKALGDGKIGGHLVLFGDQKNLDLDGEYFDSETNFGLIDGKRQTHVYYQHGYDPILKRTSLGTGKLREDDLGIWIEAQLEMRDSYEQNIYGFVEDGKMGWSSGTSPNLIETVRKSKGAWIQSWPLGLDASLTPTPAEPRNFAVPLKTYVGIDLKTLAGETRSRNDPGDKVEAELEKKKRAAVAAILGG